jgi:hypothetical protein
MLDRGLDLSNLRELSAEEADAFSKTYERSHGTMLPAYDFWLHQKPEVLKRHRLQARWTPGDEGLQLPLHGTLGFLHLYAILGYSFGIQYETQHSRSLGASKEAVLQTLEIAFIHSGPRGMHAASDGILDGLDGADDSSLGNEAIFPSGWSRDPSAFQTGLRYDEPQLTDGEWKSLTAWYETKIGEVPNYVSILAKVRPSLLKAHWARVEYAMEGPLPAQMFPFLLLQFNVARAFAPGIREGFLLGRSLGMTDDQLFDAIGWGMLYGGPESIEAVADLTSLTEI